MHKTNSPESQGNITYAVLPDGSADVWIRKNEVQLPEKDEGPQGMEADEIMASSKKHLKIFSVQKHTKKKWTEKFWPNTALIRRNYLWNYLTF